MKHLKPLSKTAPAMAVSTMEIKYTAIIQIIDRLLYAQRQAPWKAPYLGGGTLPDIPDDIDIPTV